MLKPTHDMVFVKNKEAEKKYGAIILPGSADENENTGLVVAVGPGKAYSDGNIIPLTVREGDVVLFSPHAGQTFVFEGETFTCLRESDIYAITLVKE